MAILFCSLLWILYNESISFFSVLPAECILGTIWEDMKPFILLPIKLTVGVLKYLTKGWQAVNRMRKNPKKQKVLPLTIVWSAKIDMFDNLFQKWTQCMLWKVQYLSTLNEKYIKGPDWVAYSWTYQNFGIIISEILVVL